MQIVGAAGVGKSAVLKHVAELFRREGTTIILRSGRIVRGGWQQMAHVIGCNIAREQLFNELGCTGGATLFIDNIDQIERADEWATLTDLLRSFATSPGWAAIVTTGFGNDEWKSQLPAEIKSKAIAVVEVPEISDEEADSLSTENGGLAFLLAGDHPAKKIARNLFYLSRMVELAAGQAQVASLATEIDLARMWWRFGGGRTEDSERLARLIALRELARHVIADPSQAAFKVEDFDPAIVTKLLQLDTLREEMQGATVAFRHDVLRDWALGFLFHEQPATLDGIAKAQALPAALARGVEIAARLALEADDTGERWRALLDSVEGHRGHGSWKRAILLALPRSEHAFAKLTQLEPVLVEQSGRRLSEIIKLMLAVESEPIERALARVNPTAPIPAGARDIVVPKSQVWLSIILWLTGRAKDLPTALIPEIAKLFQAWVIGTQADARAAKRNGLIVGVLFDWLARIEVDMQPRSYARLEDVPSSLDIPHIGDVREEIRMTCFALARLNTEAAQRYAASLDPTTVRHHDLQFVLSGSQVSSRPRRRRWPTSR